MKSFECIECSHIVGYYDGRPDPRGQTTHIVDVAKVCEGCAPGRFPVTPEREVLVRRGGQYLFEKRVWR